MSYFLFNLELIYIKNNSNCVFIKLVKCAAILIILNLSYQN